MNRNVESHFSMLPSADIQRSRFDRSQDHKFTFDVGDIIPFFWDEILPGDSYDITTSKVIRMQTLLAPVLDNLYLDTYFFFVPNRLLWSHWVNLMGENSDSAWIPQVEYSVPQILLQDSYGLDAVEGDGAVKTGDVLDYLGVPVNVSSAGQVGKAKYCPEVNALPLRAYQKVYEDWFRDENIIDPLNFQTGDNNYYYYQDSYVKHKPYKASKYHDYFTSALPSAQKGPKVTVPTSYNNIVNVGGTDVNIGWPVLTQKLWIERDGDRYPIYGDYKQGDNDAFGVRLSTLNAWDGSTSNSPSYYVKDTNIASTDAGFQPLNLYAAPATNDVSGLFVDVNDLRYAFQLQKLYERDARGGLIVLFSGLHVKKTEEKIWKAA